ncbi:MAG: hypothetical protein GXO72_00120 [Caldiserica bacterium]|nr:hypothetical protein [Caldisericota bacterium]
MRLDVLCIGHLDKGRIVRGTEAHDFVGGAVYFGGIVLARLGLKVGVVTRLAHGDSWMLADFHRERIEVFPVYTPQSTGIENVHPDPDSDRRTCYFLGFAGTFRPEDLPAVGARLYYVGTVMANEVDLGFLRAVAERGPLALDPQGCLRHRVGRELVTGDWPEAGEALPLVKYLKVDDREAEALTGEGDPRRAAEALAAMGPEEVVLTHHGGVVVYAGGKFHEAPFRPRSLAGRTGRGDTCFASYLGRRLLGDPPDEATRFAAALTTLKLERPGPFRGSLEEVRALMRSL